MLKFIRIRKAKNGYIFKKRSKLITNEQAVVDNEDDYDYELVQESELNEKFGEVFNPSSISQEDGEVVVCMSFCNARIFDKKQKANQETVLKAKQMFAMFQHEKFATKDIVIIEYAETKEPYMECYDEDAERVNRQSRLPILQKDGVRYIWLAATNENKRMLGAMSPHVITTSVKEVMKWYEGTRMINANLED